MIPDTKIIENIKHNDKVAISTGKSRQETKWKNVTMEWKDLVKKLGSSIPTSETIQEYKKMPKGEKDNAKDVGGFVGGSVKGGRRKAENVANRTLITLDLDSVKVTSKDIWNDITAFNDYTVVMYSTHSHTPDSPRLRLVIPLSRPVLPDEYQAVSRKIAEELGIDQFDDTTYEPHRLMYWPSHPKDLEPVFELQDGPFMDPQEYLDKYLDWKDISFWPTSSRQNIRINTLIQKQEDPLTKNGIIGAFCRIYSIPEAIDSFLSGVYLPTGHDNRYTYAEGATAGGVITYDDKYSYSHHGTDPASGVLCNAFDLVRLHKFSGEDDDTKPDTPVNRTPSYMAMTDFASKDPKVREAVGRAKYQDALAEFDIELTEELDTTWMQDMDVDGKGKVTGTINNIKMMLENDQLLKGKIAFNEFAQRVMVLGKLPWNKDYGRDWSDNDDSGFQLYLENAYGIYIPKKMEAALNVSVTDNKFHPVRDYLNGLTWDGVERLDTLLIDYLGTPDTPYYRAIIRIHLAAAVGRIMHPGMKYDTMLSLTGAQGIGKSTFIRYLGKDKWYSDSLTTVVGKEAFEQLQGNWLMEMAEMMATKKADLEAIKLFLSKNEDVYRVAYGRRTTRHPRQCVFFATTNDKEFLRDRTGDRRYWPAKCGINPHKKNIFTDLWDEVDQIWAEAFTVYKHMKNEHIKFDLPGELFEEAASVREDHTEVNPKLGLVDEYLNIPVPKNWYTLDKFTRREYLSNYDIEDFEDVDNLMTRTKISVLEVWYECFGGEPKYLTPVQSREINDILRTLKNWDAHTGSLRFGVSYGIQRAYIRKDIEKLRV